MHLVVRRAVVTVVRCINKRIYADPEPGGAKHCCGEEGVALRLLLPGATVLFCDGHVRTGKKQSAEGAGRQDFWEHRHLLCDKACKDVVSVE